ncbi:Pesticidal crystal protein Cry1Ag (plasmid) [Bacillus thuringiensis]|nr:Pesticidal crystal protein Cry1Ag [Bacillus thuringiensis]
MGNFWSSQWDAFLVQIEQLINQRIEEFARNQAISRLEGLSNLYQIYAESFREWEADPTNPALREEMRIQFNDMNSALTTAIPLLQFKIIKFLFYQYMFKLQIYIYQF